MRTAMADFKLPKDELDMKCEQGPASGAISSRARWAKAAAQWRLQIADKKIEAELA